MTDLLKNHSPLPTIYASFFSRFLAILIDFLVLAIIFLPVGELAEYLSGVGMGNSEADLLFYILAFGFKNFFAFFYFFWFHAFGGQTVGKKILGIKVVSLKGGELGVIRAIFRFIGYYFSSFMLLGFIWVAVDKDKQGWHDKLADTTVVPV